MMVSKETNLKLFSPKSRIGFSNWFDGFPKIPELVSQVGVLTTTTTTTTPPHLIKIFVQIAHLLTLRPEEIAEGVWGGLWSVRGPREQDLLLQKISVNTLPPTWPQMKGSQSREKFCDSCFYFVTRSGKKKKNSD